MEMLPLLRGLEGLSYIASSLHKFVSNKLVLLVFREDLVIVYVVRDCSSKSSKLKRRGKSHLVLVWFMEGRGGEGKGE